MNIVFFATVLSVVTLVLMGYVALRVNRNSASSPALPAIAIVCAILVIGLEGYEVATKHTYSAGLMMLGNGFLIVLLLRRIWNREKTAPERKESC